MKSLLIVLAIAFCAAGLFGVCVWPTPYKYQTANIGDYGPQQIRIHRFAKAADIRGEDRWQPVQLTEDGHISIPKGTVLKINSR